jgi:hypothetical protein
MFKETGYEGGMTMTLHGTTVYPHILGRPTEWDGLPFSFVNDVTDDGAITSVAFPTDAFDLTRGDNYTTVPATFARVNELLVAEPSAELLGPLASTDTNTVQIRTRYMMYVPPKYIPLVLDRRLTPKQLWTDLVGTMDTNDDLDVYEELVQWALLCLVRPAANRPPSTLLDRPTVPLADAALLRHRRGYLLRQLPSLAPSTTASGDAVTIQLIKVCGNTTTQLINLIGENQEEAQISPTPPSTQPPAKKSPRPTAVGVSAEIAAKVQALRQTKWWTAPAPVLSLLKDCCNLTRQEENRIELAKAGGIDAIIVAMRALPSFLSVQYLGCFAVANLSINSNNKVAISAPGGLKAIITAMRAHPSNADVQHLGCWALGNLAINSNNKVAIAAAGGIKAIITAIRAHSSNANVQRRGCFALGNLTFNNRNNKVAIAAAGGIKAIITAMRAHSSNADVQHYGCISLFNLALNSNNKVVIAAAGGIKVAERAKRIHQSNKTVLEDATDLLNKLT